MDKTVNVNGAGKKVDDKKLNRDLKLEEQAEKLLNSLGNSISSEKKSSTLAKNLVTLEADYQKQSELIKQNDKQLAAIRREKQILQRDFNKGVLIRNKLEQVCREQQKLLKSIKSESMTKIGEEEEKRKEIQSHFQESINDICVTLNKNNLENTKLKEANVEMTKKFKYLAEQYELREKQLEKIHEQINLETQLNEAKLAKFKMETTIEREMLLKDKAAILEELLSTKKTIVDTQTREQLLKDQLNTYTDKYDNFQSSLKETNNLFVSYKTNLDKMAKRTKTLEKEGNEWRVKFEKSNQSVLKMATDKQCLDQQIGKLTRQLAQLQKLCRTLQAERTTLLDILKVNGIERPPLPDLPPEPKIDTRSDLDLDIISKNCKDMKRTLAELQGQVNSLSEEKTKLNDVVNDKKKKSKKRKTKVCPTITTPTTFVEQSTNEQSTSSTNDTIPSADVAGEIDSTEANECGADDAISEISNESNSVADFVVVDGLEQMVNNLNVNDDNIQSITNEKKSIVTKVEVEAKDAAITEQPIEIVSIDHTNEMPDNKEINGTKIDGQSEISSIESNSTN